MRLKKSFRWLLLAISVLIVVFDQLTKYLVRQNLNLYQVKPLLPFWNWTLVYNKGAAFSLLANQPGWQKLFLGLIAALVAIWLVYYILTKFYSWLSGLAFSFILGGAVGNLIDRVIFGQVTDFIDWHLGNSHYAAFNLADSYISVGVFLLIIDSIFFNKK